MALHFAGGGNGSMARATMYDATFHAGPVNLNAGFGYDTGFLLDSQGLEVKWMGNGFSAGPNGADLCLCGFCAGIKKPK